MFVVIDGNYTLHRSMRMGSLALVDRGNSGKLGGVGGFLRSLGWILKNAVVDRCVVVWDGRISERRQAIFQQYKRTGKLGGKIDTGRAADQEFWESFRAQQKLLTSLFTMLGMAVVYFGDKEGDDVIYECRKSGRSLGFGDCIIVSEDKDYLQLIDATTVVYRPIKNRYISLGNFLRETRVIPQHYLYSRALIGDRSDNIVGIKGIGVVSLDRFMPRSTDLIDSSNIAEVCAEVGASGDSESHALVASSADYIKRSLDLMRLGDEEFSIEDLASIGRSIGARPACNLSNVLNLFTELGFPRLISSFDTWSTAFTRIGRTQ